VNNPEKNRERPVDNRFAVGLKRLAAEHTLAVLLIAGMAGVLFWGSFNWSLSVTNTESFCISCHEMRDNVYQEYRNTVHFSNRTGVKASCPDCHVPREWGHMLVRKVQATNELFHAFTGSISTREKFLARRWELARIVWASMAETDSRECRNCHQFDSMDMNRQSQAAGDRHTRAQASGKTCIDCHMGIAHKLPEAFLEAEHERYEREKVPCSDCHKDMAQSPAGDWDEWEAGDSTSTP